MFIDYFLKIKDSFKWDSSGCCRPEFKFVMDFSNAQLNGFKIGVAYIIAEHNKDQRFYDLLAAKDEKNY